MMMYERAQNKQELRSALDDLALAAADEAEFERQCAEEYAECWGEEDLWDDLVEPDGWMDVFEAEQEQYDAERDAWEWYDSIYCD